MIGSTTMGPLGHVGIDDVLRIHPEDMIEQWKDITGSKNIIDTKQLYERWLHYSDMAPWDLTAEGESPYEDEPAVVASQDFYPFRATRKVQFDDLIEYVDQYRIVKEELAPMLKEGAINRKEYVMASVLTLGLTTTNYMMVAENFFSTAHALAGSGSNLAATASAFSPLAILAARVGIRSQTTVRGNPTKYRGKMTCIVSVLNSQNAEVIANSMFLPGTNDNDKNIARDHVDIKVNDYISPTSTAHFYRTEKHGVALIQQLPMRIKPIPMNDAWVYTWTARESYTPAIKYWQGWWANPGL